MSAAEGFVYLSDEALESLERAGVSPDRIAAMRDTRAKRIRAELASLTLPASSAHGFGAPWRRSGGDVERP